MHPCRTLSALLLTFLLAQPVLSQTASPQHRPSIADSAYGSAPLVFERNLGQAPGEIQFLSHSGAASVALMKNRVLLAIPAGTSAAQQVVGFSWAKSQADAKAAGEQELSGKTNYLVGDQKDWVRGIANYARVRYRSIYPGVDLVYYGNHRQLEYDLEVAAGADVSRIALVVDGASRLVSQTDGSLIIKTSAGDLLWRKPVAYQMKNGDRTEIAANYRVEGSHVSFQLGAYDHTLPLMIDPTLAYAALIGPASFPQYVAADGQGSAYTLSQTLSSEYPTTAGSYMPTGDFTLQPGSLYGGPNPLLAITKFSPDGSSLVYSTYLGGSQFVCSNGNASAPGGNLPGGITVDGKGEAYVIGTTDNTNFPVTSKAIQNTSKACSQDVVVSKLSADGSSLLYSTYLGSSGNDYGSGIAVDSAENIYAVGEIQQPDFPTTKSLSTCNISYCADAFVTKIDATGILDYSVVFGGSGGQYNNLLPEGVAVDASGSAYIAGYTSIQLPTVNALEPKYTSVSNEAFVGEINSAGTGFDFLTYLGGSSLSSAAGIALDPGGNIYVTGFTTGTDFPVQNAYQPTNKDSGPDGSSGFVTKYSPGGKSYVYSTYLGGTKSSEEVGITVGPNGEAFVTGLTQASDFPVTPDAYMTTTPNGFGTTFTAFTPSGTSLAYSTYFAGTAVNGASAQATSIASTPDGENIFIAGYNYNEANVEDFPVTPGAYDHPNNPTNVPTYGAVSATFVTKWCMSCESPANLTVSSPQDSGVLTSPVQFTAQAYDPNGVAAIQIYLVPGKVAYETKSSSLNTKLKIAPGSYNVVIQEWSKTGTILKKTVSITVQNVAPTVVISSPKAGSTVSDPVHVVATAKVNGTGTIVHYRVYSSSGVAVYDANGSTLNAYVTLPQGNVPLTVVAWDSSGAAGAATANITVSGGSSGPQVVITSPVDYSSVNSPVTFTASATTTCKAGIYALQIYTNPGVLAYTAYASSVSKAIALSPGYYYGAVQAWDNCGATYTTPVQFDVQ